MIPVGRMQHHTDRKIVFQFHTFRIERFLSIRKSGYSHIRIQFFYPFGNLIRPMIMQIILLQYTFVLVKRRTGFAQTDGNVVTLFHRIIERNSLPSMYDRTAEAVYAVIRIDRFLRKNIKHTGMRHAHLRRQIFIIGELLAERM